MKLVSATHLIQIEISDEYPTAIIIENNKAMADITADLNMSCENGDGSFVFSDGNKELSMEKYAGIIVNPFAIDFNDKRILSKLYEEMLSVEAEGLVIEKQELNARCISYIDKIIGRLSYEYIDYNTELDSVKFFKLYGVGIKPECSSLAERLGEYIKICARLLRLKLLILINIRSYLSVMETEELFKLASYSKVCLLLIDNKEYPLTKAGEKRYIIDNDLCLINI